MNYLKERAMLKDNINAMLKAHMASPAKFSELLKSDINNKDEDKPLDLPEITLDVNVQYILREMLNLIDLDNEQSSKMNIALQALNGVVAICCMVIAVLVKLGVL